MTPQGSASISAPASVGNGHCLANGHAAHATDAPLTCKVTSAEHDLITWCSRFGSSTALSARSGRNISRLPCQDGRRLPAIDARPNAPLRTRTGTYRGDAMFGAQWTRWAS